MRKLSLGPPRPYSWADATLRYGDKRYHQRSFSSSRIASQSKKEQDKPAEKVQSQAAAGSAKPSVEQESRLEIDTKHGKLLVKTTLADSKLQEIVIEKPKLEPTLMQTIAAGQDAPKQPKQSLLAEEEARAKAEADLKEQLAEKNRQLAKKRIRVDFSRSSLERNFITPVRAMSDFLLKPSDLEALAKTKRRSPYEQEPPITVYWRKDVEAKAIEVWGSRENLLKECLKREIEKKMHQQSKNRVESLHQKRHFSDAVSDVSFLLFVDIFTVKRRLRDYRREIGSRTNVVDSEPGLFGKSGKVVLTAIAM